MKILVLQQVYPSSENPYAQAWSHTRNKIYVKEGAEVRVIASEEREARTHEGIQVYPLASFNDIVEWSDIVVAHQPNLKVHFRCLVKKRSKKVVYFIHGHEVMFMNEDYPRPFFFNKDSRFYRRIFRFFYDRVKVLVLRYLFFRQGIDGAAFVFVSDWMKSMFHHRMLFDLENERFKYRVIANSISEIFSEKRYSLSDDVYADFVSIRQWDWSKHAVDLVLESAIKNSEKTYHIYGKGDFPKYVNIPDNVKLINKFIDPNAIPDLLNHYRCAMMPTRVDSQGVMACEMASYGMPLITSDISVAREFLSPFSNVRFVANSEWFSEVTIPEPNPDVCSPQFLSRSLCKQELEFFEYFKEIQLVR